MRPPPRIQSRLVIAAVALGIGFLVAVQVVGTDHTPLSRLAAERPEDLTRILADLNDEADRLARQVSALRVKLLRYRGSARAEELALRDATETLADLVQELRDAGAEAVAVADVRVVASTWFGPAEGGVLVDDRRVSPPYELAVIGPPDGLEAALDIPGGPLSVIAALSRVDVEVRSAERLTLPPTAAPASFRYARPTG